MSDGPSEQPRTLAELIRADAEPRLRATLTKFLADPERREAILRRMMRTYDRPPDWVVHVAVEVYSVDFPRVQKRSILTALQIARWLFFDAPIGGACSVPPHLEIPPDLTGEVLRLFGHLLFRLQADSKKIEEVESWQLSPEARSEFEVIRAEMKTLHLKATEALHAFEANKPPEDLSRTMETIVDAKRATLDPVGNPRNTSATHIYRKILEHWRQVEMMSGPSELTKFLEAELGESRDSKQKYDLVWILCKRSGIVFKPVPSTDKPTP